MLLFIMNIISVAILMSTFYYIRNISPFYYERTTRLINHLVDIELILGLFIWLVFIISITFV
ncbi:hypothetical protein [Listeria virus P61]|nr:hypothetical protein [Listeria virus P61]